MVQYTPAQKLEKIRELYDKLPKLTECKGLCFRSCEQIPMSEVERNNIEKTHGLRLVDPPRKEGLSVKANRGCPALGEDHKCTIYEDRPLICRAWGAIEQLPCRFGCKPEGDLMSPIEFGRLNAQVSILGGSARDSKSELIKALNSLDTLAGQASFLMLTEMAMRKDAQWWNNYIELNPDNLEFPAFIQKKSQLLKATTGTEVSISDERILLVNGISVGQTVLLHEKTGEAVTLPALYCSGTNLGTKKSGMFVLTLTPDRIEKLHEAVLDLMEQQGEEDAKSEQRTDNTG
jgi:Fe-S-cluster containining protein